MRTMWRCCALALLPCCSAAGPLVELPDKPFEEATRTDQSYLLLYPVADAEPLLGRPVKRTDDGRWTIADARAPGCEVKVTRSEAEYRVERTVDLSSLTTLSVGFAKVVALEARHGAVDKVDIHIDNRAILAADTRGPCGETIVDKVFVGRGKRELVRMRSAGGAVSGVIGAVAPGLEHQGKAEVLDTLEWTSDQAYGYSFKQLESKDALTLKSLVPSALLEGQRVELSFETSRPAWLVVYFLDERGEGTVLWPSSDEPSPSAAPGRPAVLPSAAEKEKGVAWEAQLLEPGRPTRETLVVYAFAEQGDFERVKPGAGMSSEDGAALAAALTAKLQDIPLSRWARAVVQYEIRPRQPAQ